MKTNTMLTFWLILPSALIACASGESAGSAGGYEQGAGGSGSAGGSGGGPTGPSCGAGEAPAIVAPAPAANQVGASVATNVAVTFSCAIAPSSVAASNFVVRSQSAGTRAGDYSLPTSDTIALAPTRPFFPGERVNVTLTDGLHATTETPLSRPFMYEFVAAAKGGSGVFAASAQGFDLTGNSDSIILTPATAFGDFDDDGDLDLVVRSGGDFRELLYLWRNDGHGSFTRSAEGFGFASAEAIAAGDLDGDGDLDLFVGRASSSQAGDRVFLNDGAGNFASVGEGLGEGETQYVALGDVDGDGDLDALTAKNGSAPNQIWINDGSAGFTSGQALGSSVAHRAALADLDGDGALDAFISNGTNFGEPSEVWRNDGTGAFIDSGQAIGLDLAEGSALGDLDADGDLDVFVATAAEDRVWLNDGSGTFSDSGQLLGGDTWAADVALGDIDGDGDLDAVVANNTFAHATQVFLNDGQGKFTKSSMEMAGGEHVALGDVDGDGDLDVFTSRVGATEQLWINQ